MGTSSSRVQTRGSGSNATSSASSSAASSASALLPGMGRRDSQVRKKYDSAAKTGVLNLSDLKLKNSLSMWAELSTPPMARLKTLDLSGNDLKSIPVEVYGLLHLKAFFITGCQIQYTNDLRALVKLAKLKLDHNDLEVDKIGPLPTALATLDLSFNHLSGLPAVLNGLTNLIFLDISSNRIESLYGIDGIPALVSLIADDNLLVELPDSICLLVKLKKLSLARNRIGKQAVTRPGQSIPEALLENSELDHIDLAGNVALCKADVMAFAGINKFLQRRQALSDKNFQGGAMTDGSLFGLD